MTSLPIILCRLDHYISYIIIDGIGDVIKRGREGGERENEIEGMSYVLASQHIF
jgi:hypothetical protein